MNIKDTLKSTIRPMFHALRRVAPQLYFFGRYYLAARKLGNDLRRRDAVFQALLSQSVGKKCLQIGVKEGYGAKFGTNWVSVDKYDTRDFIDFHYDIHDLKFPENEFDTVVCISILEHIPYPEVAIKEMRRVLKPGGAIWVQLPFHYPYHESPKDYWRASPDGLRVWMKDFTEIECGSFLFASTSLVSSTYFYGVKPDQ